MKCKDGIGSIIIFSDDCVYQNGNLILSNAVDHEVEIMRKYLVVGHTQMQRDSVHTKTKIHLKGRGMYVFTSLMIMQDLLKKHERNQNHNIYLYK